MSALSDFAEWFKVRRTPIERWYSDDVGRYAFRVTVDGHTFICAARTNTGRLTSVMKTLAGRAQTYGDDGAYLLIRVRDRPMVFDPVTILAHGTPYVQDDDRRSRGEEWVEFPTSWGVGFDEFVDYSARPDQHHEVASLDRAGA